MSKSSRKLVRIAVSLDEGLLEKVAVAHLLTETTRSAFIRDALRNWLKVIRRKDKNVDHDLSILEGEI